MSGIARPIDGLEFRELNEHTVAGREVELLRKEYDILHYFMSRPNHTIDKAALAEGVWGDHIDQADNFDFVYAQMKNLRRKLEKAQEQSKTQHKEQERGEKVKTRERSVER